MQIITDPAVLQEFCRSRRAQGRRLALVPTMGAYHAGHENLMRAAAKTGYLVLVSLFVNPAQFEPGEDLSAYPRDMKKDAAIAEAAGADVFFLPETASMYAPNHAAWVEVPDLAQALCGASRPGHFRGVCTVVLKLLMLMQPTLAFFGEKDRQQLLIIRRMVRDFNIPVEIRGCSTTRDPDGLALSSRNVYLTQEERAQAPALYAGLLQARLLAREGERRAKILCGAVREYWAKHLPLGREDYLSLTNPDTLRPVEERGSESLLAAAVYLGKARLIDNILLS